MKNVRKDEQKGYRIMRWSETSCEVSKKIASYEEAISIIKTSPLYGEAKRTYGSEGIALCSNSMKRRTIF